MHALRANRMPCRFNHKMLAGLMRKFHPFQIEDVDLIAENRDEIGSCELLLLKQAAQTRWTG